MNNGYLMEYVKNAVEKIIVLNHANETKFVQNGKLEHISLGRRLKKYLMLIGVKRGRK